MKSYVNDAAGVLQVGQANVGLDSVVIAYQDGQSPEAIQLQYPALTLEEVYGAITYYLANRTSVDDYLFEQSRRWSELRKDASQNANPVVARLRMIRHSEVGDPA